MRLKLPSFMSGIKFTVGIGIAGLIAFFMIQMQCENSRLREQLGDKDTTKVGIVIKPPSVKDKSADSTLVTGGMNKKDSAGVVHHRPRGTFKISEKLFTLRGDWSIVETFDGRDSLALKYDLDYLKWKLILRFGNRFDFRKGFSVDTDPSGILGNVDVDFGDYTPTKKPRSFNISLGGGSFASKPALAGEIEYKMWSVEYLRGTDSWGFLIKKRLWR